MHKINAQQGIGLAEVLVALLLLSIAVLGFSALQLRAISATDESLVRTKALTLTRNLSEVMRAYPEAYVTGSANSFNSAFPATSGANPTIQAIIQGNAIDVVKVDNKDIKVNTTGDICLNSQLKIEGEKKFIEKSCNINQLAARDALIVKNSAKNEDINIAVVICPDTTQQDFQRQMCIITAWNETEAVLDDNKKNACANTKGIYKIGSHCLISEAY